MRSAAIVPASARRLLNLALTLAVGCTCMVLFSSSAVAQPVPPPSPTPSAPTPSAPTVSAGPTPGPVDAPDDPQPAALNSLIEPDVLESLQQSIVGLVTVWEEPEDPFAIEADPGAAAAPTSQIPIMSICTGWFDTPTTIATAGHCVDPKEGRLAMDMQNGPTFDPTTGEPLPVDPVRPEPERTVYAFQPRELPGAVITSPVIVRVDSFRAAEEGDTAKLEMYGMPPARPLAVASAAPRLGEPVTSIGFPGMNIGTTDGINVEALLSGGKTPAEVLQDSRLQPVNSSGTITARQFQQGVAVYQINADLAEGTSGGPTINSRGEVYGINSQMTLPFLGQNFNIITDTGMLREFLGHDGSQFQEAPTNAASDTGIGLPTGWIIFASVLAGAVLGGLVSWLVARSRSRRSRTDKHSP